MNNVFEKLKKDFKDSSDFVSQSIKVGVDNIYVCYVDNMIDKQSVNKDIVEPIKEKISKNELDVKNIEQVLMVAGTNNETEYKKIVEHLLGGFVVVGTKDQIFCCPCQGYEKRGIEEPPTSAVLKGPREGFGEDVSTNMSLIRRRLKTKDLCFHEVKIGKYSSSKVVVGYISSIADKKIVKQVIDNLKKISIDAPIDSFYVESLLEPKHSILFKQIGNTEKPDVAVSKLLEGRVVIIVDGSPMVLTVPFVFLEDLQSGDDYYNHSLHATLIRLTRLFGLIIAIMLPGVYVALESFHHALLPIDFLISLQSSIEGLSFPPLLEILLVIFMFEILNEASVRMPRYSGMALSVVGALVLGDTAVQAGIISPPAVIMVAISGITLFTVPEQTTTVSILRFIFTFIGGVAGFYGILISFMFLVSYLMNFDSYGSAYFAPYAPNIDEDKKDGLVKQKLLKQTTRPKTIPNINKVRLNIDERID